MPKGLGIHFDHDLAALAAAAAISAPLVVGRFRGEDVFRTLRNGTPPRPRSEPPRPLSETPDTSRRTVASAARTLPHRLDTVVRSGAALVTILRTPAVGLAYAAVTSVLAAALLYVLDLALDRLTGWSRAAVGIGVLIALLTQVYGGVRATRFWRRWLPWYQGASEDPAIAVGAAVTSLALLTFFFAGLNAFLYANGWTRAEPPIADGVVWHSLEHFVWHFCDAVPALEVPKTLDWSLSATYVDHGSGALLLAYKILAILPIVRFVLDVVNAGGPPPGRR